MARLLPNAHGGEKWATLLRDSRAFSLIELLLVLTVMILLLWLVVPALFSIIAAQEVTAAGYDLSAAVEQARNEAVTRRTYVWLAMEEEVRDGNLGLRIGTVRSKDGKAHTNASNLMPVGKALHVLRIGLLRADASSSAPTNGAVDLTGAQGGIRFKIGQASFDQGRTLTFMPKGEVSTNPAPTSASGFDPVMFLSICKSRGTNISAGNNVTMVIDGSVGTPAIYRNQ